MCEDPTVCCEECGYRKPLKETIDDYGQSFGISHMVCESCWNEAPEPDTGRPDWEDL